MKKTKTPYKTSKHHHELWFNDKPPHRAVYFGHSFDDYTLEGRILYNSKDQAPWVFSIHGARADFTKADAVAFGLQKRGYSLLGINLSGHSKAGKLALEETTLGDNVRETETFYQYLDKNCKKIIIAYSLGGTPALKLLKNHNTDIEKLVLFYPGIYTKDAYTKHFGKEFQKTISQPFSYRDNDTIELLHSFKGDVLLVKGKYDGLDPKEYDKPAGGSAGEVVISGQKYFSPIPKDVIDMVYNAVPKTQLQLIEIPSCGHSVILWMREHPEEAERLLDRIDAFLKR